MAVVKVVSGELSVTAAAAAYGISRQRLTRLVRRCRDGGLDAPGPRSRRPLADPHGAPDATRDRVVALRRELTARGPGAGPAAIAWHLGREGRPAPSTSAIRRIPRAAHLVVPEPRKRPRSPWTRSGASASDECWRSDSARWRLADGGGVEIIDWPGDHSRCLLGPAACARVAGDGAVATFLAAGGEHGWPAATPADNAAACASRLTGGRAGFERPLARLGIRQRNGAPGRPQTQGKAERLRRTLRRWPGRRPPARAPAEARAALPEAHPAGRGAPGHFRLRCDTTDKRGAITLRRAGRPRRLRIGAAHARRRAPAIVEGQEAAAVALDTGEVLSSRPVEPGRGCRRNRRRDPGRRPGSRATG